jgi:hypothetical protein
MKKNSIISLFALFIFFTSLSTAKTIQYEDFFTDSTMRIDYYHTGDATSEYFALDQIYRLGRWAGTRQNLVTPPDRGRYRAVIYDKAKNLCIFQTSFDSFFGEYKVTKPAQKGILRTFHETICIPFPKQKIIFVIEQRNKQNIPLPVFRYEIDPTAHSIIRNNPITDHKVLSIIESGACESKVDIVFLSEGYSIKEELKFEIDLKRFTKHFFEWEPYRSHREKFNISGIFTPSPESGVDEPRKGIFKRTVFHASFNALGVERYLVTEANKEMRDIASQIPYDVIFIMANSERYGGCGIYNQYCTFTTDAPWNIYLLHHEFGHSFAGLGDEYFDSSTAYDEFYAPGVEPLAPNITALLEPAQLKWNDLLSPGIKVPTPWGKSIYDSLASASAYVSSERRDTLTVLETGGADPETIERIKSEYDSVQRSIQKQISAFYENHPLKGITGVFEGAGYATEGFFRPTLNSIMHRFTETEKIFYPVNKRGIIRIIEYYTQ